MGIANAYIDSAEMARFIENSQSPYRLPDQEDLKAHLITALI
jgi:hypothetical protein